MTLTKLLASVNISSDDDRMILGISDDSREVQKDWLFIARDGTWKQGADYIEEALSKGAVVLFEGFDDRFDIYHIDDIANAVPVLLHVYYQDPWRDLCMIGVTGTNGKSSVANILTQLLHRNQQTVMLIGTGQITYLNHCDEIHNTTPSIFLLMKYFQKARQLGITTIVMEISSHAIDQHRIRGIFYDYIIYTNITQDHLDYHRTKTHYQYTKFKLRNALKEKGVIILNGDDPVLQELYTLSHHKIITCGTKQAHYFLHDIHLNAKGSSFQIHTYEFHTSLLSIANIYNIVQALIVCRCMNIPYAKLQCDVKALQPVAGRLQCLPFAHTTIWIDYAHTYMAVRSILDFANSVKEGNVIMVVGCGGEREIEKRQQIGQYVQEHSDIAIFTTDNPRREAPSKILFDMLPSSLSHVEVIENRRFAIKHAIKIAGNSDIIIIAGKGNEKTQAFMNKEYAFHDETCVYEILKREEIF